MADLITRRSWLIQQAILRGTPALVALEAVDTTLLAHPELDGDEQRTWDEWEEADRGE